MGNGGGPCSLVLATARPKKLRSARCVVPFHTSGRAGSAIFHPDEEGRREEGRRAAGEYSGRRTADFTARGINRRRPASTGGSPSRRSSLHRPSRRQPPSTRPIPASPASSCASVHGRRSRWVRASAGLAWRTRFVRRVLAAALACSPRVTSRWASVCSPSGR